MVETGSKDKSEQQRRGASMNMDCMLMAYTQAVDGSTEDMFLFSQRFQCAVIDKALIAAAAAALAWGRLW